MRSCKNTSTRFVFSTVILGTACKVTARSWEMFNRTTLLVTASYYPLTPWKKTYVLWNGPQSRLHSVVRGVRMWTQLCRGGPVHVIMRFVSGPVLGKNSIAPEDHFRYLPQPSRRHFLQKYTRPPPWLADLWWQQFEATAHDCWISTGCQSFCLRT